MPTPEQILSSLHTIANQWQLIAIFWHIYFAVIAVGLLIGIHPAKRIAGILFALPLLSVSVLAWASANPFNGIVFAVVGVALMGIALRLPDERISIAPGWAVGAGVLMFLFGWIYPHFLDTSAFLPYFYAAPTGLVPCPTLSIVIGLSLVVAGLDSRLWALLLGISGLFYGLFGALRLGVIIDLVLLFGALLTFLVIFAPHKLDQEHALAR